MTLFYKPDKGLYEIYDITYDSNGFPQFLIYEKGQWVRKSAKHFTPDYEIVDGFFGSEVVLT